MNPVSKNNVPGDPAGWQMWAQTFPMRAAADAPYKSPFTIIQAKADEAPQILLYGPIGKDFLSDDGITATEFAKILAALPKGGKKPKLRIDSPGGNVWQ